MDLDRKLNSLVKNYDYISFDIFDTLLKRNVMQPTDIFKLVEKDGVCQFGDVFNHFAQTRVSAENEARNGKEEVSLDNIYDAIGLDLQNKEWAKSREIYYEEKMCSPNIELLKVYNECLIQGKHVEIISDMYLPIQVIKRMLGEIGITRWDNLFLSNDLNKTKRTGSIFKYVTRYLKIKPNQLLHIGDNPISDYKIPKSLGIKSLCIDTVNNHLTYHKMDISTFNEGALLSYMNNHIAKVSQNLRTGYENFGPLLYGFSTWLYNNLEKNKINNVFFLSRDGLIMKKAFDLINDNHSIKSHYLYSSRRALQVPMLAYSNFHYNDFVNHVHWPPKVTFHYFLKSLGIESKKEQEHFSKKYSLELDKELLMNKPESKSILENFFNEERGYIQNKAKSELNNLLLYWEKSGLFKDKVGLVDIGWHGNMQLNMSDIFSREDVATDVKGYYIGVDPFENHSDIISMDGYCFAPYKNLSLFKQESEINVMVEQAFMAKHGSLKRFDDQGNPVLYDFEQKDTKSISVLDDYQKGALCLVEDFYNLYGKISISSPFALSGMIRQFLSPTMQTAYEWGSIVFKDINESRLVHGDYTYSLVAHPVRFIHDYERSMWREGYLKIHLKHNYNFYYLTKLLKKPSNW